MVTNKWLYFRDFVVSIDKGGKADMGRIYEFELVEHTNNWRKLHGIPMIRYVHANRLMDARVDAERRKARQLLTNK